MLDNAECELRSGALAAAMTAATVRGRVLGVSQTATAPWSACVIVTGNNVALAGDVSTRFLRSRLDAGVEAPEERDTFRIGDLRAWTLDHRAELAHASMTLLRWGALLGHGERPRPKRFGRFEDYDRLIRAPLVALGQADPGDTHAELRAEDPEREDLVELLTALRECFDPGEEFTRDDAFQKLKNEPSTENDKPDDPREVARFGYRLRAARGRVAGGLVLERVGEAHRGKVRWRVREVGP